VLGIGNLISSDVSQLRFADMWVAIISLGIFSLLFTSALKAAERWATLPWMRRKKATQWLSPL
jgi:ABC-type nitrate/sulfonate/bicarbonate transport system permease component